MYIAHLWFGRPRGRDLDAGDSAAHGYLAALLKNGQVCEYMLSSAGTRFQAFVELPRPNALEVRYFSHWVQDGLKTVVQTFGRKPRSQSFDRGERRQFPSWKRVGSLYLETNFLDRGPPVHSPEFSDPIPLYLLPISQEQREGIRFWMKTFQSLDELWIGSSVLETEAYKQLAEPRSHLSVMGREICSKIEKATKKPTYYRLLRYHAHRRGEENRACPLCGKPWASRTKANPTSPFDPFEFRCGRCRLVSDVGVSLDGERLARIGDFKPGC